MIFLFQFKLKFKEINSQFFGNQRVFSCCFGSGGFIIWNYVVFFFFLLFLYLILIYIYINFNIVNIIYYYIHKENKLIYLELFIMFKKWWKNASSLFFFSFSLYVAFLMNRYIYIYIFNWWQWWWWCGVIYDILLLVVIIAIVLEGNFIIYYKFHHHIFFFFLLVVIVVVVVVYFW